MKFEPWIAAALTLLLTASACAPRAARGVRTDDAPAEALEEVSPSPATEEKVTEFDINYDKKPDVWTYAVARDDGTEHVIRKEFDLNYDGKVDLTRMYGEKGGIERDVLDLDFDGRTDQVNHYDKGQLVRKERDLDYDGKPDQWVFYEKGQIARKELDSNRDGKIDEWEYWENGEIDRVGKDVDADGTVDQWVRGAAAADQ